MGHVAAAAAIPYGTLAARTSTSSIFGGQKLPGPCHERGSNSAIHASLPSRVIGIMWLNQSFQRAHGTTAVISARNTSRFVRFFLPAKSSDAKLS